MQFSLATERVAGLGTQAAAWAASAKIGLVERSDEGPGLALALASVAEQVFNEAARAQQTSATLAATQALPAGVTMHANLGWVRDVRARAQATAWSLAAERTLVHGLDATAEIGGDDRTRPSTSLGLRWLASRLLTVSGAYGRQPQERGRSITIAATLGF